MRIHSIAGTLLLTALLGGCGGHESAPAHVAENTPPDAATPATRSVPEASAEGTLLLRDDFSDPTSGWSRSSDAPKGTTSGADYDNGRYVVFADNDATQYVGGVGRTAQEFGDVRISVEVERLSGSEGMPLGISCRDTSAGRYFADITEEGTIRLGSYGERQQILQKLKDRKLLHPGVNRLELDCVGDTLTFRVNGEEAATAHDAQFTNGRIALRAGGTGSGMSKVAFDNIVVTAP